MPDSPHCDQVRVSIQPPRAVTSCHHPRTKLANRPSQTHRLTGRPINHLSIDDAHDSTSVSKKTPPTFRVKVPARKRFPLAVLVQSRREENPAPQGGVIVGASGMGMEGAMWFLLRRGGLRVSSVMGTGKDACLGPVCLALDACRLGEICHHFFETCATRFPV